MSGQKDTIIYIGDPLCSWCYGISGELSKMRNKLEDTHHFELLLGGLRPGGGDEWNEGFRQFLKHHWEEVGSRTGMSFGYDLLKSDYFLYDTEPSCRAVVIMKELRPSLAFTFFSKIQEKFYQKGADPKNASFYEEICEDLGVDYPQFEKRFASASYKQKTYAEFEKAQALGVRSFPTIIGLKNGGTYMIAQGYRSADEMIQVIESSRR